MKGAGQDLKTDFEIAFIAAGVPEGAALFVESADRGETYYFSPEATRIFGRQLDLVRARNCPPPRHRKISVAVGHGRAMGLLKALPAEVPAPHG